MQVDGKQEDATVRPSECGPRFALSQNLTFNDAFNDNRHRSDPSLSIFDRPRLPCATTMNTLPPFAANWKTEPRTATGQPTAHRL